MTTDKEKAARLADGYLDASWRAQCAEEVLAEMIFKETRTVDNMPQARRAARVMIEARMEANDAEGKRFHVLKDRPR